MLNFNFTFEELNQQGIISWLVSFSLALEAGLYEFEKNHN